jgi:hypothetical protein
VLGACHHSQAPQLAEIEMRAARMGRADLDDNRSTAAAQVGYSPDGRSASVIDEP